MTEVKSNEAIMPFAWNFSDVYDLNGILNPRKLGPAGLFTVWQNDGYKFPRNTEQETLPLNPPDYDPNHLKNPNITGKMGRLLCPLDSRSGEEVNTIANELTLRPRFPTYPILGDITEVKGLCLLPPASACYSYGFPKSRNDFPGRNIYSTAPDRKPPWFEGTAVWGDTGMSTLSIYDHLKTLTQTEKPLFCFYNVGELLKSEDNPAAQGEMAKKILDAWASYSPDYYKYAMSRGCASVTGGNCANIVTATNKPAEKCSVFFTNSAGGRRCRELFSKASAVERDGFMRKLCNPNNKNLPECDCLNRNYLPGYQNVDAFAMPISDACWWIPCKNPQLHHVPSYLQADAQKCPAEICQLLLNNVGGNVTITDNVINCSNPLQQQQKIKSAIEATQRNLKGEAVSAYDINQFKA